MVEYREVNRLTSLLLCLIPVAAFSQAITNPSNPTNNPNQVNVTTSWLYLNKMHYAGTYSSAVTYNSQDLVISSGAPYISLQTANVNNTPVSSPTWWVAVPGPATAWGALTGTLSSQTDLQTALNAKQASLGFTPENAANKAQASGYASLDSGTKIPAAQLPNPTASTLGGVESLAAVSHNFLTSISTSGVPAQAQPVCADLSNAATSCSTDATNATNISSGTLPAARLPNPSATTLGGVQSKTAVSNQFLTTISTSGVPASAQPAFTDISGTASAAQLPNPSSSTLGGIESLAAVSHNFLTSISTSGVPAQAQPAFTDISGTATAAQVPSNVRVRAFGVTFDGGGSALTGGATTVKYLTVPFACTISATTIMADAGTATVKTWKVATGTAIPTSGSNLISTSGISLASGTALHTAGASDFTTTTVTANDMFGFNLSAVATATQVNFIVECDQ